MSEMDVDPKDCPTPEYHRTHHYCPGCSFVSAEAQEKVRAAAEDKTLLEGARDVLTLCEGIIGAAKEDPTSTTEGAVYLAADVVSRLTGQRNASELVKSVYG